MNKLEALEDLRKRAQVFAEEYPSVEIENRKIVLYGGNPEAYIMILARDLGQEEVAQEEPLIGKAGRLFRAAAQRTGFDPEEDLFLCNTVPLKPHNNNAFSKEVRQDFKWILREMFGIVRPTHIMTLGLEALQSIYPATEKVGPFVGASFDVNGIYLIPNWHPSYVSRGGGLGASRGKEFLDCFYNLKEIFYGELTFPENNL